MDLTFETVSELADLAHCSAQLTRDLRESLWPKEHQGHEKDDEDLPTANVAHRENYESRLDADVSPCAVRPSWVRRVYSVLLSVTESPSAALASSGAGHAFV